jgi:DNA-binding NarL/FixJ family response regulator
LIFYFIHQILSIIAAALKICHLENRNSKNMRGPKLKKILLKDLKILVVDDHVLYSNGLIALLKMYPFITKIDYAENGLVAHECLKKQFYDIVFLDVEMPEMNGTELAKIMKRNFKKSKIIIMTAHNDRKDYVYTFLEIGVSAYLLKAYIVEEFVRAFETVLDGGDYITHEIKEMYQQYLLEKSKDAFANVMQIQLTKAEKRVVLLICEQNTTEEIADILGVRKTTVNTLRKRIFEKLNVSCSVGVVVYAVKVGWYKP